MKKKHPTYDVNWENRVFLAFMPLYCIFPTLFKPSEASANSIRIYQCVLNVVQWFGDLHCIFCPSKVDKIDGIISVRGGKLSLATTRRLLKGRIVLRHKSSNGWRVIIGNRGNQLNKMIEINKREDIKMICSYLYGF